MKIEVGKFYKTRDGRKAWVFCREDNGRPVAAILNGEVYTFSLNGAFNLGEPHRRDLVEPWVEPEKLTIGKARAAIGSMNGIAQDEFMAISGARLERTERKKDEKEMSEDILTEAKRNALHSLVESYQTDLMAYRDAMAQIVELKKELDEKMGVKQKSMLEKSAKE